MNNVKTCRDCRWAEWERDAVGRIMSRYVGRCTYPVELPKTPVAIEVVIARRRGIWAKDSLECGCHERKESR